MSAPFTTKERTAILVKSQLLSAEALGAYAAEDRMPLGERETWGKLESALATSSDDALTDALVSFMSVLPEANTEPVSQTQVEAACVLALEPLYRMRVSHSTDISAQDIEGVLHRLTLVRDQLQGSTFNDPTRAESYDFELEVLQTLLENGKVAFIASPGEESSSDNSQWNHDVYMLDIERGIKAPIQIKLGSAKKANYTHGVRSVSRKAFMRSDKYPTLADYMRDQIPEMSENRYSYTLG